MEIIGWLERRLEERPAPYRKAGAQTLERGLDILEAVASGTKNIPELATEFDLSRSTVYRFVSTLLSRQYLVPALGHGYSLGPKALEMGYHARLQLDIVRAAGDYLESFVERTGDVVHLAIRSDKHVLLLDRRPGRRRVVIGSRVGRRYPLCVTALGKALLIDEDTNVLLGVYRYENTGRQPNRVSETEWLRRMHDYARHGYALDLEEYEIGIRCVAAPIRDLTGQIRAAVSISVAVQYADDERMRSLIDDVRSTAREISSVLGWRCSSPAGQRPQNQRAI